MAAPGAAAGVVGACGHHHQLLLAQQAGPALDFEIQLARQADHHLRMFMAMGNQVVAVMAQRQDLVHDSLYLCDGISAARMQECTVQTR